MTISRLPNLAQNSRGEAHRRIAGKHVLFGDREPIGALRQFLIKASD